MGQYALLLSDNEMKGIITPSRRQPWSRAGNEALFGIVTRFLSDKGKLIIHTIKIIF